jgi:alkylated DNA repair dioxygenase AlkB
VLTYQPSLVESVEPKASRAVADPTPERVELTHGAWVDLARGWMPAGPGFGVLLDDVPWRAERRPMYERVVDVPRLLAFYAKGERLPSTLLAEAREALDWHYRSEFGESLCTAGLCLYRNGQDSVAWHGDTIGRGSREDTLVAIVSLGATRPLLLRPVGGGLSLRFDLAHGDLLVMGGSCQRTWQHSIPKSARPLGPRISIQFRPIGVR